MRLLDVTLRDGGLKVGFAWPERYAQLHYSASLEAPEIEYVELGYWKQQIKYDSPFFRMDEDFLHKLTSGNSAKACVMIDYHYASKHLGDYPRIGTFGAPSLIRMTARSSDVESALQFGNLLRNHTGIPLSLNFSNISNTSDKELIRQVGVASRSEVDMVYFADSHGSLDLAERKNAFVQALEELALFGKKGGIHLHNHSHRALSNFEVSQSMGFDFCDATLGGLGKGGGNLRLESVATLPYSLKLADLWHEFGIQSDTLRDVYYFLSGHASTVDHYADWAWENNLSPSRFWSFLTSLPDRSKDSIDESIITSITRRFI